MLKKFKEFEVKNLASIKGGDVTCSVGCTAIIFEGVINCDCDDPEDDK